MDVHPTKNVSIGIDPYPYPFMKTPKIHPFSRSIPSYSFILFGSIQIQSACNHKLAAAPKSQSKSKKTHTHTWFSPIFTMEFGTNRPNHQTLGDLRQVLTSVQNLQGTSTLRSTCNYLPGRCLRNPINHRKNGWNMLKHLDDFPQYIVGMMIQSDFHSIIFQGGRAQPPTSVYTIWLWLT